MRFSLIAALSLCAFAASAAAQNAIPASLVAAIDATQASKADYAFSFAIDAADQRLRLAFDPHAEPNVRLVHPAEGALDERGRRVLNRVSRELEGVSWCASDRLRHIADVRLLSETGDISAYAFQPTAESSRGILAQLAPHLRGEMVIAKDEPDIRSIRIYAPAPFSPLPLTEVASAEARIECATAPNGRNYVAMTSIRLDATAFGQPLVENSIQRTSDLEPR